MCTQANNSVLIDDPNLAAEYRSQWDALKAARDETPKALKKRNTVPRDHKVGKIPARLWFTPTIGQVDLEEAKKIIGGATDAILFLMFNPGPKDTLLNQIIDTARQGNAPGRLYVRRAINQDPSTTANPVALFDFENSKKADFGLCTSGRNRHSDQVVRPRAKEVAGNVRDGP